VFDLDAGAVTIVLPDAGTRFMSMQIVDEDQYTPAVYYGSGRHRLTREQIGSRYASAGVRILADFNDDADLAQVHAIQDQITVEQKGGPGCFEPQFFDRASQDRVRDALLALGVTVPDSKGMFGSRHDTDPIRHLIGTAMAFGGNPDKDALYLGVTPPRNDGKQVYRLTVRNVPVDGFWSVSVYDARGHFVKNARDAYTVNNITAKKDADGSVTITFGGCTDRSMNCLPVMPGWNYLVRLYRPRPEILEGAWRFPAAYPVQ
jgi:hypothetical protein